MNTIPGELQEVYSEGYNTNTWFDRTFVRPYKDVVYISANPMINSKGIDSRQLRSLFAPRARKKAPQLFKKIVDVWDYGWDWNVGTVLPETVNETVKEYQSQKRKIIHYLQPHHPYLKGEGVEGYLNNLKLVLSKVKEIFPFVTFPVIITSDHGESLGDIGRIGDHGFDHPLLHRVPWLVVK